MLPVSLDLEIRLEFAPSWESAGSCPAITPDGMETYHGYVLTRHDAVKLFEACRLGLLPRVQRRLSEQERESIRSGSVFVWDEREAGIRRWTDGKSWSAGRVSGCFLKYKEMEGKRGRGFGDCSRCASRTSEWRRNSDENHHNHDHDREEYRYKGDGLMKQHFSSTTPTGQHLHLISYYCRSRHGQPQLSQPSADPSLRDVVPPKGMYPGPSTRDLDHTPALVRTPMQQPYIVSSHYSHSQQLHLRHQEPYTPHLAQPGCGCGLCVSLAATLSHRCYATDPYSQPQRVQAHEITQPRSAALAPVYLNSHYKRSTYEHELSSSQNSNFAPPQYQGHHQPRRPSPPELHDFPRQKVLQTAAHAAPNYQDLSTWFSSGYGWLALPGSPKGHLPQSKRDLPPDLSLSPPQTSQNGDADPKRSSIFALLHPTLPSSEARHTNPASNGSSSTNSPRANES